MRPLCVLMTRGRFCAPAAEALHNLRTQDTFMAHTHKAVVVCGRQHVPCVRMRSGRHDYEGLSYRAEDRGERFAVVDLSRMLSGAKEE
ncbi:hypothetical protein GUJ93_ZPchr0002g23593 [Zizania palustris]|uniref:Uncharacterized protein n=1 Tax=Zizania palustris TaxID=103762 RepID=A0A8J5VQR9_ZIZPA|nr:hypothetical protein GUJ93_ZPchr0002g23593 [Zizania palustris]